MLGITGELAIQDLAIQELAPLLIAQEERLAPPAPAPLRVASVDMRAMLALEPAWSDLVRRAVEPNVFLTPAFAIPLLQHVCLDARPTFLLVWEMRPATEERLLGLLPIYTARPVLGLGPRLIRGLRHPQMALGTPLLDRDAAASVFETMLDWLGERRPRAAALVLAQVPADGPFCLALQAQCGATGRGLTLLDEHQRAVLRRDASAPPTVSSSKRRGELQRQRRRMEAFGPLTTRSASTPSEIRRAAEQFLALEFAGWKGRRGTALLARPCLATFTRTMTRLMAHEGRCRIDSLEVAGRPVAMGIVVSSGDHAYFWKTTFSEAFAMYSPGVQLTLGLSALQAGDESISRTDSCAVPDHPMIDRLWRDRLAIADLMIELRASKMASPGAAFAVAVRLERLRRSLRQKAKALILRLRRHPGR